MAYTRKWEDIFNAVKPLVKSVPANFRADYCDFISSEMWASYPFKEGATNIAPTALVLQDGVQDYSSPPQIFRLLKCSLFRNDVTPNVERTLDVVQDLETDLTPKSFNSIAAACLQQEIGMIRLDSAIYVPTAGAYELRGVFQQNHTKVSAMTQQCWFPDLYANVAAEGVLYWLYKLTDDVRAGGAQVDNFGHETFTGQLGTYKSALLGMKRSEDYGSVEQLFGGEVLGAGRDLSGLTIYGP